MNLYSFSSLSFSFGVTLIAMLALVKRRDLIAFRFLFFSISVCGWGYPFSFWINQGYSMEMTLFLTKLSHVFAVFIPVTWLHFVLELLGEKEPFKKFFLLNYSIAGGFAGFCISSDRFISGLHSIMGFKYYTSAGPLYALFAVIFWLVVPYGLYLMWKVHKTTKDGQSRSQIKMLSLGTLLGFASGSATFFPIYHIPISLEILILMPLYPFFTGIALMKYGLFDAQQIADAFQREKLTTIGIMAASLNHELRNPLYVAKGKIEVYLDAIERELYPSKEDRQQNADKVIHIAISQLHRAMDIIQRFSDFSKPFNTNRDKQRFLIKDLLCEVKELVSHEFQIQRIRWREEIQEDLKLHANRRQIEEVFLNLILNACHAMEESGGELFFKAAQSQDKIIIEISDTGSGISGENLQRIFEPFYSTKQEKGTGLGLYITKRLVEKNGAKIQVRSKLGQGTTFILEFKP